MSTGPLRPVVAIWYALFNSSQCPQVSYLNSIFRDRFRHLPRCLAPEILLTQPLIPSTRRVQLPVRKITGESHNRHLLHHSEG